MDTNLITYQKLKIEPFELRHINKLKVTKIPNEHSTLYLTGILDESSGVSYAQKVLGSKAIKVKVDEDGSDRVVFSGLIDKIEVKARPDTFFIKVEAVSHSIKTDIEWIRRSYQDLSMTYASLMEKAVEKHEASVIW